MNSKHDFCREEVKAVGDAIERSVRQMLEASEYVGRVKIDADILAVAAIAALRQQELKD